MKYCIGFLREVLWRVLRIKFEIDRTVRLGSTDAGKMLIFSPIRRPKPGAAVKIVCYRTFQ